MDDGRSVREADRDGPHDGSLERTLWLAAYVALILAPLAFVYVADRPSGRTFGVELAAGLGFVAMTVLALELVMPSRAGSFTAPFGIDVLLRFHRQMALVGLVLVLAHVAVLVADDGDRAELLNVLDAPFRAQAAVVATAALIGLVVTSLWREPLRLSYEAWRGLHVGFGALVIAGSFAHVIGVSKYLGVDTIRWASLLFVVVALGAVFYLRVGRPFAAAGRAYRVAGVRPERGGATTLELEADGHGGVPFHPGQFAWLKLARAPYGLVEHPFSFSSSAERAQRPQFTIKARGDFTERVESLEAGTRVLVDGPHGSFQPDEGAAGWVLVAGGIGITPAMSLLRTLADRGSTVPVVLVYASRTWEDVTFREELAELEKRLPLRVVHVLSRPEDGWSGERGRVDAALLERILPDEARGWSAFACGPPAMTESAAAALDGLGLAPGRIHVERFESV